MANYKQKLGAILVLVVLSVGCDGAFSKVNDKNWQQIGIGQKRSTAINLLGKPDAVEQISVLGLETERLSWDSHFPTRHYQLELVLGRVVAKHLESE